MTQWNEPGRPPRPDEPTRAYGPQYGGQYGPQYGGQYGPPPAHQNPFGTEGNEEFGIVGMVFALLGGVLLIVCLTALQWFDVGGTSVSFGDVDSSQAAGFASSYFGWFAWTFFVLALIAAVGSSFPSPALRALRVIGVVCAFATAGLSFLALQVTTNRSYLDWLEDARIGFYLAVVGFVLIGIGAAIGPRKVSPAPLR